MRYWGRARLWVGAAVLAVGLAACGSNDQVDVAEINNDWTGNEIKIEGFRDAKVSGVTCHMAHFDRSVIDRLRKGDWFENPSNGSITCAQTGPIVIGDIKLGAGGEEVFRQRQSPVFKKLAVRRVYDRATNTLVYLVYSKQIVDGSAKMSIGSIPLYGADVIWENGEPQ
jgi:CreA protein